MTDRISLTLQFVTVGLVIAGIVVAPSMLELFSLMQVTLFAAMAVLSLSLAFIWGFGGILSFGQTAFFGLGAYAYAVSAINYQDSTQGIMLAIFLPAVFAAILGYFVFYGRVSDVYLGIVTLTVTLILFNLINSTSDVRYRIGNAVLGGFNGMPAVPNFNMPFDPSRLLSPEACWWVTAGTLLAVYLGLRLLLASPFGRVLIAVRENETRAALIGYDPRAVKLIAFILGGAIAGLAGALYANWSAFVGPTIFSLSFSAEVLIWVIIGGVGTLIGPIIGCILIQYLVASIGSQQLLNSNLVLGAVLVVFVLLLPAGLVPTFRDVVRHLAGAIRGKHRGIMEPVTPTTGAR